MITRGIDPTLLFVALLNTRRHARDGFVDYVLGDLHASKLFNSPMTSAPRPRYAGMVEILPALWPDTWVGELIVSFFQLSRSSLAHGLDILIQSRCLKPLIEVRALPDTAYGLSSSLASASQLQLPPDRFL